MRCSRRLRSEEMDSLGERSRSDEMFVAGAWRKRVMAAMVGVRQTLTD